MMDNKFWMNVWAVIVAMLLMSWVVRPVLSGVLGVKEGNRNKKLLNGSRSEFNVDRDNSECGAFPPRQDGSCGFA